MSQHTPHELHDAFPDDVALLSRLKVDDAHFADLADRYHELNRAIHRVEAELEPASDDRAEELKKQRLAMLDEIAALLATVRTPAG